MSKYGILVKVIAIGVIVLAMYPYIYGYRHVPAGMTFMGFADHPYDQNSYLSRIQQASEGNFFIRRDFTLEEQRPLFFNPFTWTLGVVCLWTGFSPLSVYIGSLVLYGLVLLATIHWFIGLFTNDKRKRVFAFALCAFSSGLCWIIPLSKWQELFREWNILPIDYWIAETITFETIFSFPQFALTLVFVLLPLGLIAGAGEHGGVRRGVLAGLCTGVLAFLHPVDVVTVYLSIFLFIIIVLVRIRRNVGSFVVSAVLSFAVSLPAMLYQYYIFSTEPVFIEWSKELFISPNLWSYIIGYGIVLFLAIPGIALAWRGARPADMMGISWLAIVASLLYFPITFQRRLTLGIHVPICVFAAAATFACILPFVRRFARGDGRKRRLENAFLLVLFLVTVPANFVKVAHCINDLKTKPLEFYLFTGDVDAMRWMKENHNEDAAVLSTYRSGLYIPPYTGNRVYVGHWSETLKFDDKRRAADWVLYSPGNEGLKVRFLREHGIEYIYFGNFERMRGRFALEGAPYLQKMYDSGGASIHSVNLQ